jgi:hypothetical protein
VRLEFGMLKPRISGAFLRALAEKGAKGSCLIGRVMCLAKRLSAKLLCLHRELFLREGNADLLGLTLDHFRIRL